MSELTILRDNNPYIDSQLVEQPLYCSITQTTNSFLSSALSHTASVIAYVGEKLGSYNVIPKTILTCSAYHVLTGLLYTDYSSLIDRVGRLKFNSMTAAFVSSLVYKVNPDEVSPLLSGVILAKAFLLAKQNPRLYLPIYVSAYAYNRLSSHCDVPSFLESKLNTSFFAVSTRNLSEPQKLISRILSYGQDPLFYQSIAYLLANPKTPSIAVKDDNVYLVTWFLYDLILLKMISGESKLLEILNSPNSQENQKDTVKKVLELSEVIPPLVIDLYREKLIEHFRDEIKTFTSFLPGRYAENSIKEFNDYIKILETAKHAS